VNYLKTEYVYLLVKTLYEENERTAPKKQIFILLSGIIVDRAIVNNAGEVFNR